MPSYRSLAGAVDCGVERWVVVHLKLSVKLESALAEEGLLPENVETTGKVIALVSKNYQAGLIAFGVACWCVGALDLFACVVNFEGEDGEAVDHEAWGFRMKRSVDGGEGLGLEMSEEGEVEFFCEVVAALVGFVNETLDAGEF
jgi:hypothetical protein